MKRNNNFQKELLKNWKNKIKNNKLQFKIQRLYWKNSKIIQSCKMIDCKKVCKENKMFKKAQESWQKKMKNRIA